MVAFVGMVFVFLAILIMYLSGKKQGAKFLLSQNQCAGAMICAIESGSREMQQKCLYAALANSIGLAGECIKVFINQDKIKVAIDLLSSNEYVGLDLALEDHERAVEKQEAGRILEDHIADEYRKISYNRIVILVGIAHRFLNRKQINSFNYLVIDCRTRKDKKVTKALAVVARKYNLRSLIL